MAMDRNAQIFVNSLVAEEVEHCSCSELVFKQVSITLRQSGEFLPDPLQAFGLIAEWEGRELRFKG